MPAEDETYSATAAICAALSESENEGIPPWPFVTRSITSSFEGLASSRFGPTAPELPAAASVWQPPQADRGEHRLPVVLTGGWRDGRGVRRIDRVSAGIEACDRGDVGRDVLGVLAGEDVLRHSRRFGRRVDDGVGDLPTDDLPDGRLVEAVDARLDEGKIEIGADLPGRAGVGERVAGAAALDEELLPALLVAGALRVAHGLTAARENRCRRASRQRRRRPRVATAAAECC